MDELFKDKSNRDLTVMRLDLEKESHSNMLEINQAVDNRIRVGYQLLQIEDEFTRRHWRDKKVKNSRSNTND